jgi:hypothetical protein
MRPNPIKSLVGLYLSAPKSRNKHPIINNTTAIVIINKLNNDKFPKMLKKEKRNFFHEFQNGDSY